MELVARDDADAAGDGLVPVGVADEGQDLVTGGHSLLYDDAPGSPGRSDDEDLRVFAPSREGRGISRASGRSRSGPPVGRRTRHEREHSVAQVICPN